MHEDCSQRALRMEELFQNHILLGIFYDNAFCWISIGERWLEQCIYL